jgi:hypothetical protein
MPLVHWGLTLARHWTVGASKKLKKQPHPLLKPSSVNFCQNLLYQSHETVPLICTRTFVISMEILSSFIIVGNAGQLIYAQCCTNLCNWLVFVTSLEEAGWLYKVVRGHNSRSGLSLLLFYYICTVYTVSLSTSSRFEAADTSVEFAKSVWVLCAEIYERWPAPIFRWSVNR